MKPPPDLQASIENVAREIQSLVGKEVPSFFDRKRWSGTLMQWSMADEDVKVQLFRCVDVLPSLKSDALVVKLFNEYFADLQTTPVLKGLGLIAGTGFLPHVAGKVIRANVESMARQFIAGRDEQDALKHVEELRKSGLAISMDLLGEEVLSDSEAQNDIRRYLALLDFLGPRASGWEEIPILDRDHLEPLPHLEVSLKVSSFYAHLDPIDWDGSIEHTRESLRPVIERAHDLAAGLVFDMEHYYLKDLTLAIFKSTFEEMHQFRHPGIALQAYLPETKDDVATLIQWAKKRGRRIGIRLTKGAYWDHETVVHRQLGWPVPVFRTKDRTDAQFEELTWTLLENVDSVRPGFATHNIRSISHAIAVADHLKLPREAVEFQMIYGMAEPIRTALRQMGYRVRIYTPVGELLPGMAYLIRRLLENTSNESFLRKSFAEDIPLEELSRPPRPVEDQEPRAPVSEGFNNEPVTDFSRAENRDRMRKALTSVRKRLGRRYPIIVAGEDVWTDAEIVSLNPARPDEIVGRQCAAGTDQVRQAVDAARLVWRHWRETSPEWRGRYLLDAAERMREKRFELAALEVYEVGKTWTEADADVTEAIDFLEYYGREMIRIGAPRLLGTYPGEENLYVHESKGVGVVIGPWNFPLAIPTGMVSAGIVTGNCVIFKPSSLSPVLGWRLAEIFRDVGLPPGVLQFLPGPGDAVGEALVSHPQIDFVIFTGSTAVGLRIAELTGKTHPGQRGVKKVVAEMGGKNAIIIDETADLDAAVKGVLESALSFQGQKCSACSRVVVVGHVFDEFCGRLNEAMQSVRIGPPEDPQNFMGPLIDEAQVAKARQYIEIGKIESKELLIREVNRPGYFVGPAIFVDVAPDSRLAQEEIFGPVVSIMRAADIDAALKLANSTPYALTGGIFSRSPENIRKAESEFRVGNLYINRKITGALVGRQPFGGFGMSGVGSKAGGPDYLLQFMNARSISENTLRRGFAPKTKREM